MATPCANISPNGYLCTKDTDHSGPHEAFDVGDRPLASWHVTDVMLPRDDDPSDISVEDAIAAAMSVSDEPLASSSSVTAAMVGVEVEVEIEAMPPFDLAKTKTNPRVNLRASGVNTFGLYTELDELRGGEITMTMRILIVNDIVFWQRRSSTARGGSWRSIPLSKLNSILGTRSWETRGDAIVVQLQSSDVEAIRRGQVPVVRYAAKTHFENLYGKGA